MTLEPWMIALVFSAVFSTGLWAVGRWVLPRAHKGQGTLEDQIEALQLLCGDWEKKFQKSEEQNKKLEDRQEFLLDQLEKSNIQMSEQRVEIQQLKNKV